MDTQAVEVTLRELRGDGPFGDARLRSNRIQAGVSLGLQAAARNLLTKAVRAVAAGDEAQARGYVQRALRLPVDEHEEIHPSRLAALMLLFGAVTDAMEACPEDDTAWLDAAEQAMGTASDDARQVLLYTLWAIANDYQLQPHEARRIRTMVGDTEPPDWSRQEQPDPAIAVPAILDIVHTFATYQQALAT